MNYKKVLFRVTVTAVLLAQLTGSARAITLDEAIEKLKTHRFGQDNDALNFLRETAIRSYSDPDVRKNLNEGLVRILDSDAAYDARQFACRQLALTATAEHVPALARHLTDEKMSHMALYVLTHIDSPEVDKALLAALDKAAGRAKLGIINMLGNRRCAAAIEPLGRLMVSAEEPIAVAAIRALGRIGTKSAHTQLGLYDVMKDPTAAESEALSRAHLDCAAKMLNEGQTNLALRTYRFAFQTYSPVQLRALALKGLTRADPAEAIPLIVETLSHDQRVLRQMAVHLAQQIPGEKNTRMLADRLPSLSPGGQVTLLHALAARGDATALAAVKKACDSEESGVRIAALEAVGTLGDASTVQALAERAGKSQGPELEAARNALEALRGDNVNSAIVKQLETADDRAGAELITALARRNAVETTPVIIRAASGGPAAVRNASLKALRSLAGADDIAALLDLLTTIDRAARDETRKTIASVAQRCAVVGPAADIAVEKLRAATDDGLQASILILFGDLGDGRALPLLRLALADESELMRDAAVRGLSQWPAAGSNGEPMDDLLGIVRESDNKVHRVLALRGYINLISTAGNLSPVQKVEACKTAMTLAEEPSEKKQVLAKIAEINSIEALGVAQSYLKDADLKAEAAAAATTIGQAVYHNNLKLVEAVMQQVLEAGVPAQLSDKARQVIGEIDAVKDYLTDWQVAGPYVQQGKHCAQLFEIPFGPELPNARVQWKPMPVSTLGAHPAYLDLLKELNGGEQRVAYLRTKIDSEAQRAARLEIFSDDGVKAWLNGRLVHANNCLRAIPSSPDTANVTLKKGSNELMLKITQNNMPWGAIVLLRQAK